METNLGLSKDDYKEGDVYFLDFKTQKAVKYNEAEEGKFNNELGGLLKNMGLTNNLLFDYNVLYKRLF